MSSDEERAVDQLLSILKDALEVFRPQGLLLSGGIDSGLLMCLCPKVKALSVTLEDRGTDLPYLDVLARSLVVQIEVIKINLEEAFTAIPKVIKLLSSFDPALPNDLAVYFGLRAFVQRKVESVATGDGADELFGGYTYMTELDDLLSYQRGLLPYLSFSSNSLGEVLGLKVLQPFLSAEVVEFALGIPSHWKIRRERGRTFGKWLLRKALLRFLPEEYAWQEKRPLEIGTGMVYLRELISEWISDEEFERKKQLYGMTFYGKEHLYFFEVFKEVVGEIPPPKQNEVPCPNCGAGKQPGSRHCKVCGVLS